MKTTAFIMLIMLVIACSKHSQNVPDDIKNLKNLTVYSAKSPLYHVRLQKEQIFGNREKVPVGRVMDVGVDESGRVYIADGKQRNIKIYGPDGHFLAKLGREGKGPGEFVNIINIKINDNKLFAYDNRQQRAIVFSLDSLAYDYTVNLATNRGDFNKLGGATPDRYYVRHNNTFLIVFLKFHTPKDPVMGDTNRGRDLYYILNTDGKIISKKLFKMKSLVRVYVPIGKGIVGIPVNFYGKSLIALSDDDHIYTAWSNDFLIKIYSSKGIYQHAFYYPYEKVPLTRKSITSDFINQRAMQKMDLPKTWPALHSMKVDDQNWLWISTIVKNQKVYQWWVLDKRGKLLARFTWPRDKEIETIKDGHLYTRETDVKGVPRIVRYQIEMH